MSTDENPLGLFIPSQTLEISDAPYLKPKEAERWITELPIAHIGETARLIYKAMAEINRVSLPLHHRFKILESFRKPFDYVTKSLLKHYIGQAFPLSPKSQKISELTRELQWEIANGYKILINSRITGNGSKLDDKTLLTAIYRAMYYLSETLVKSYLVYAPANDQTWLELNHLYLFAEHNGLISEEVKDPLETSSGSTTISCLYKQTILLALANPYRLSQSDIQKVNYNLKNWSRYSHLHMLENISMPIGLFTIDLEKNSAPSYYNANKHENSKYTRVLDTSELTRILRDQIDAFGDTESISPKPLSTNSNELSHESLKRLILAWGAIPKRNFSRKGKKEKVKVALGLGASHFFIQKQLESQHAEAKTEFTDSQIAFSDRAHFDEITEKGKEKPAQPDIWDIASNPNLRKKDFELPSFEGFENFVKKPFSQKPDENFECYDCVLVNESAGGFCISWDNASATKTVVGSLISLKILNDADAEWNIGVIRWIKAPDSDSMYLGIELISPNAQPIASKNISQKNISETFNRSLLLPELRSLKQPQTLVTQSMYKVGDKLELDVHAQSIKVKLTKLLESTSTFSQFQFSIIKTVKKVTPQDKMDRIKNFDSIWSSI